MDLRRLRVHDWLLGAFGLALLGSLWLEWYAYAEGAFFNRSVGVDAEVSIIAGDAVNAWEAFAVTDFVLALAATMAIGVAVVTAFTTTPALSVTLNTLTAIVSGVAALWLSVRALWLPGDAMTREVGASLAPALAWLLAIASWTAMRNERPGRARMREVVVEELPAPPPAGA